MRSPTSWVRALARRRREAVGAWGWYVCCWIGAELRLMEASVRRERGP
jgi:hypothetical protein